MKFKNKFYSPIKPMKNIWRNDFKSMTMKNIWIDERHDSDWDGVPNFRDCQPFNPLRQDNHKILTDRDVENINKSLMRGRDPSQLSYPEFARLTKEYAKRLPIIQVEKGYGIYAHQDKKGNVEYNAIDMKTGLFVLGNRKSLEKIINDIRKGEPEELRKRFPELFSVKYTYESGIRRSKSIKKYGGRAKRFKKYAGQFVLDLGAGMHPDYRATHAIDLVKPEKTFKGLKYKWGYNFNKETTNLPYKDNSFDVVVSIGSLGRNFESRNIYKEIYRVLKPGGRLEFNPDSKESVPLSKQAGLKNHHMESYFDESLNKKISVIIAKK